MSVLALQTEIFETGYIVILNCAFIISDVTQSIVLQFLQNFLKKRIFLVLPFFLVKLSKSQFSCLILQDFERPLRWNQLVLALQFSFNKNSFIQHEL